jgi:serine/threonine protein kinase
MNPTGLTTLLVRWEEDYARGRDLSAQELCRDRPELADDLGRCIDGLRAMYRILQGAPNGAQVETLPPPSAGESLPPAVTLPTSPAQPGLPAAAVPGYEILEELGRGAMGVVYRARQVKLNRIVALKMILAGGHAGADALARFRREAKSLARLQLPNIVQVYEVGEHEGRPFFSLEYCPGGSLDKKLDGTPLPPAQAAQLVETLARAMHAAHEAQVVHRDLKPGNVLLQRENPQITQITQIRIRE